MDNIGNCKFSIIMKISNDIVNWMTMTTNIKDKVAKNSIFVKSDILWWVLQDVRGMWQWRITQQSNVGRKSLARGPKSDSCFQGKYCHLGTGLEPKQPLIVSPTLTSVMLKALVIFWFCCFFLLLNSVGSFRYISALTGYFRPSLKSRLDIFSSHEMRNKSWRSLKKECLVNGLIKKGFHCKIKFEHKIKLSWHQLSRGS